MNTFRDAGVHADDCLQYREREKRRGGREGGGGWWVGEKGRMKARVHGVLLCHVSTYPTLEVVLL